MPHRWKWIYDGRREFNGSKDWEKIRDVCIRG